MECYEMLHNMDVLACLDQLGGSETLELQIHNFLLLEIIKNSKGKCQIILFIASEIL
jgi:hypothetical protein